MFLILMGVSGSGKTAIGRALAQRLGWPFYDGDDYHSPANVAKMAAGVPLTDGDRAGWLAALAALVRERECAGENGVLACSALKGAYRDVLRGCDPQQVRFVYLKGSYEVILERMQGRGEHYFKPALLESQFAILEEPGDAVTVDVARTPDEIVRQIMEQL